MGHVESGREHAGRARDDERLGALLGGAIDRGSERRDKFGRQGVRGRVRQPQPLEDTAVSTSGDYERYFERNGVRYHHILDPSTGRSATGAWSVTILGPETSFTDALSTSVFVMGPERGLALINQLDGVDAIIIDAGGTMRYSADLEPLVP